MDKAEEEALKRGWKKGMEKGIAEGMEKGTLHAALNLKQLGVDIETISKATGLSPEQIEKL
ncbi:MAG: hypothetical protein JXR91_12310 [Deltaproteobacteria bacterium]|nr:hypothetical protein [Deltaproteobacteria bacterium]